MTEQDIINLIKSDTWMMNVLGEAEKLDLPDWMIGAGFLRNKVWDYLHNIKREMGDTRDIDLVYFNSINQDENFDKELSKKMKNKLGIEWEIINQAYAHKWHSRTIPYKNSKEALSEWVETATSVAVNLKKGELKIIASHGIEDLVNLIVRPVPSYKNNLEIFHKRYSDKKWLQKWNKLKVAID